LFIDNRFHTEDIIAQTSKHYSFSLSSVLNPKFKTERRIINMCSHCGGSSCGCGHDDKGHEHKHEDHMKHFEEHLKEMSKEELSMKKEKLEKKLALVTKLLKEKK